MSEPLPQAAPSAQLGCPKCRASITYYDVENSTHYACPSCRTYFEYEDPKPPKIVGHFLQGPDFVKQVLPLGATGVLPDGLTYRVVGYSARSEKKSNEYRWGEYVLFCAPDQYAQLAVYEGHWTFIKPGPKSPRVQRPNTRLAHVIDGEHRYELYNKYQPRLHYAVGEFDYDIRNDEKLTVQEFIDPPAMLVREMGQSVAWYRAEHIEPRAIARAFDVPNQRMPWRSGTGAIQPAPGETSWTPLLYLTLAAALLLVVAQLVISTLRPSRVLLNETYVSQRDTARAASPGANAVIVTPSFEVQGPTALQIHFHVSLDNQWLELPAMLINEQTGQHFEFTRVVEYYRGYEDGESWSEGSTDADVVLGRVPSGRYHLNLYPATEIGQSIIFRLKMTENATLPSNLLLLLAGLFLPVLVQYIRRRHHNQQRWANSDYGPQDD